jgi:DNA-binding transcriptional MerR regulator
VSFNIPDRTFFRIGDVAKILGVKPYVIRFWESEFPFVAPEKALSGQRVYRRSQIDALILVKHLLHVDRYSIEGAKKKLTELRRHAKLRDAMDEVLASGKLMVQEELPLQVGSVVPKESISVLEKKVRELQILIREPAKAGLDVPGLKAIQ